MTLWHTIVALVIAMALLNMAVTILTPATLSALATKNSLGAQWVIWRPKRAVARGPQRARPLQPKAVLAVWRRLRRALSRAFSYPGSRSRTCRPDGCGGNYCYPRILDKIRNDTHSLVVTINCTLDPTRRLERSMMNQRFNMSATAERRRRRRATHILRRIRLEGGA